jgi:Entner-Doudoroff aldolase
VNKYEVFEALKRHKIVAVLRGNKDEAKAAAERLILNGVRILEITFTVFGADELIKELREKYKDGVISAESTLTSEEIEALKAEKQRRDVAEKLQNRIQTLSLQKDAKLSFIENFLPDGVCDAIRAAAARDADAVIERILDRETDLILTVRLELTWLKTLYGRILEAENELIANQDVVISAERKDVKAENAVAVGAERKAPEADNVIIGAGTVLDAETARVAILAGAEFVVSPSACVEVVKLCNRYSVAAIPGITTATELLSVLEYGADFVKLFPANIEVLKALKGPFPNVGFMVTGGVDEDNLADFLKAGASAVGAGSNLTKKNADIKKWTEQI